MKTCSKKISFDGLKILHPKVMKKLFFLLWFIPFALSGQRYISGHITDADDNSPIPGIFVFISNTGAGTTTDTDGYYQLAIPGEKAVTN